MKLNKLQPRTAAFKSSRPLATLSEATGTKRITGRARVERNRRLFQQNPLCVECMKLGDEEARRQGYTVVVDEWDHIVPLWRGGADHETNLQGLCRKHHDEKSAREEQERQSQTQRITIA